MPQLSLRTLATGARQLVVQLALLMHLRSGVSLSSLTPRTHVRSAPSLAGALRTTRLAPACEMGVVAGFAVFGAGGEDAGAFDDDVDAQVLPGELGRILDGQGANLFAVDDEVLGIVFDFALEAAVVAVVLEQRGEHLVVGQIVDRDDLELAGAAVQQAKGEAADATETVDGDFNGHCFDSDYR